MKQFVAIVLFVFVALTGFSQKSKVSGKVTNSRNEGLAGVTIKISGDINGTTKTDIDGRYSINVDAGKNSILSCHI